MYRIFIPTTKKNYQAKSIWHNAEGRRFVDFLNFKIVDKITVKDIKDLCKVYNQEAIFVEAINKSTGRKNRAYCYNADGTKDIYNKRICYNSLNRHELYNAIKNFFFNYTIEKEEGQKNSYILFTWTKKIVKINHEKKRKNLIKKLIVKCCKVMKIDDNNLQLRVKSNNHGSAGSFKTRGGYAIISIAPGVIKKERIIRGYENSGGYYQNRGLKVNPYILNNYKKALRFVILHEIGHLHFIKKYCAIGNYKCYKLSRRELYADVFALHYLKEV